MACIVVSQHPSCLLFLCAFRRPDDSHGARLPRFSVSRCEKKERRKTRKKEQLPIRTIKKKRRIKHTDRKIRTKIKKKKNVNERKRWPTRISLHTRLIAFFISVIPRTGRVPSFFSVTLFHSIVNSFYVSFVFFFHFIYIFFYTYTVLSVQFSIWFPSLFVCLVS